MPGLPEKLLLLAALASVAIGCKPKIGDDCQISTDCSAQGDRLCDITSPSGYCTVFNCEPGACPEDESLCVQFGSQRSPANECIDLQSPSPYARTFCMAVCESQSDCRDGYECADVSKDDNKWGATRIDTDRGAKVCLVPFTAQAIGNDEQGDVCSAETPSENGESPMSGGGTSSGGSSNGGDTSTSGAPATSGGEGGAPAAGAGG